jgi:predicted DNA binding CopG/RHH family protein
MKHEDGLTDEQYSEYQALAAKYDQRAKPRKDATLNMRISSEMLEQIKALAANHGYDKYQTWVHDQLAKALDEAS